MNRLALQLARDLRQGSVRKRAGRFTVADLVEHLIASGAAKLGAERAVRDLLTMMKEHRSRRTLSAWPTCPRCQGGVVPEKVYDEDQPELMTIWRCLTCGHQTESVPI